MAEVTDKIAEHVHASATRSLPQEIGYPVKFGIYSRHSSA